MKKHKILYICEGTYLIFSNGRFNPSRQSLAIEDSDAFFYKPIPTMEIIEKSIVAITEGSWSPSFYKRNNIKFPCSIDDFELMELSLNDENFIFTN